MGILNLCKWDLFGLGCLKGLFNLLMKFDSWFKGMNCFLFGINVVYLR